MSLVGFASSAEAVTALYSDRDGDGQVTLLIYPPPQLAAARLREPPVDTVHQPAAGLRYRCLDGWQRVVMP